MRNIVITSPDNVEPIKANYFEKKGSNVLLIIIGGSGDKKDKFNLLVKKLVRTGFTDNILTFSFRGYENEKFLPLKQQIRDLEEVLDFVGDRYHFSNVLLCCTSAGAVSCSFALANRKYQNLVSKAIFLDPADYSVDELERYEGVYAWNGASVYNPDREVVSDILKNIAGDVIVDVVRFSIRNSIGDGYAKDRGRDYPGLFPRLNEKMVRAFYDKLPPANKGTYIEINNLPHAFMRDGNVSKNYDEISKLIVNSRR